MSSPFLAHAALVLHLLDKFGPDGGRIKLLSSIAHYRRKTQMSPYIPEIPTNLDELAKSSSDNDKQGRGFQRYANSKLVITTWTYALNRYLQKVSTESVHVLKEIVNKILEMIGFR